MHENMMDKVIIGEISHNFSVPNSKTSLEILEKVSFTLKAGKILCIIGPSGSGKTTLLKIIAGLLSPKSGSVTIDYKEVTGIVTDRILLFQELFLFDWLTVSKNISFAFEVKNISVNLQEVEEIIKLVGLKGFEDYYPKELSGGMKQRLALGRALAAYPSVLLLDEPFSSLDFSSKLELESQYLLLKKIKEFTSIIVTHDVRQAIYLGDQILIMTKRPGKVNEIIDISSLGDKREEMWQSPEFHKLEVEITKKIQ